MQNSASAIAANARNESEFIAVLEEHCQFPGPFMFKVIAYAGDEVVDEVVQAVGPVLACGREELQLNTRPSKKGSYLSISFEPIVDSPKQVLRVYDELKKIKGIITIF
jgi:putative lipoic acid-binding regulatory protein